MDWSYVSGFFDGEGTVGIYDRNDTSRPHIRLQFSNTNRGCLAAIHAFLGCGNINGNGHKNEPNHAQGYALVVADRESCLRVAMAMLPHSIIKREKLAEMIAYIEGRRWDVHANYALESQFSSKSDLKNTLNDLYWSGRLTHRQIATRLGVSRGAVRWAFDRYGIRARSGSEAGQLAWRNGRRDANHPR